MLLTLISRCDLQWHDNISRAILYDISGMLLPRLFLMLDAMLAQLALR